MSLKSPPGGTVGIRRLILLSRLSPFFRPYWWTISAAFVALVITSGVSLAVPVAVRLIVDSFRDSPEEVPGRFFLLALVLSAMLAAGSSLRYALVSRIGERLVADIRKSAFARAMTFSPAYFEKILTGEIISRINTDSTLILTVVSSSISLALRSALLLTGGLCMMFLTSQKLTMYVLMIIPVVLLPILVIGRHLRRLSRDNQDSIAEGSANAVEALAHIQAIQANTHEGTSIRRFDLLAEQSVQAANRRIWARSLLTFFVIGLAFTGIVVVIWIGTFDVRREEMSAGEMFQFLIYAVMACAAVASLSETWGELLRAAGAAERLLELLDAEDVIHDPVQSRPSNLEVTGKIRFEEISFRYPSRPEVSALSNVSFSAEPGETIALVGRSGAGKSTVFQLLLRYFDPESGKICIDGIDLRDRMRSEFRRYIALVPQDPAIFSGSLLENIRFGKPSASDTEVVKAAELGALLPVVDELPKGFDTQLGERGVMLSGGQKQRVAISRAILRNAPILLLDEATSSLDAESERAVQKAVSALSENRTTLVIAHRLVTVKRADRILVFDKGRLVDQGTHESLISSNGTYARFAKLQFADANSATVADESSFRAPKI